MVYPVISDVLTVREMAGAVKRFRELLTLSCLSDVSFLRYAYTVLRVVCNNSLGLLNQPPVPWSTNPQRNGLLTFQNFLNEVVENVQIVHRLLFQGAIQSASLTLESSLITQLETAVQQLELSLIKVDRFIIDAAPKPTEDAYLSKAYNPMAMYFKQ